MRVDLVSGVHYLVSDHQGPSARRKEVGGAQGIPDPTRCAPAPAPPPARPVSRRCPPSCHAPWLIGHVSDEAHLWSQIQRQRVGLPDPLRRMLDVQHIVLEPEFARTAWGQWRPVAIRPRMPAATRRGMVSAVPGHGDGRRRIGRRASGPVRSRVPRSSGR